MSVRVPEDELLATVSQVIQVHVATALDMKTLINSAHSKAAALSRKQELRRRIKQVEEQLERLVRLRETLYDDYLDGLMNEHDYIFARNRYTKQEAEQTKLLDELTVQDAAVTEIGIQEPVWLRTLLDFHEKPELTRKLAQELIDRITVYSKTTISVKLRFEDEYESMLERLLPPMGVAANE